MDVNKLIKEFLLDNKPYLIAYIIFMLAYPISSVVLPKYYGSIMESIKDNKDPNFLLTFSLLVGVNIMYGTLDRLDTIFIPKLQAYIRTNIVKVVLSKYKDQFEEQELGSLISKIVKLPIVIRDLVRQVRNYIVPLFLILLFVIIRFAMVDKRLGIIAFLGVLSMAIVLIPKIKKCLEISSHMDDESDSVHESISELFDNMLNIYSMNTTDKELKNLEQKQEEVIKRYKNTFVCSNTFRTMMNSMGIVLFLSIIIYAYKLYKKNEISLSNMLSVVITGMYTIQKIGSFSGEVPDIIFNVGVYQRIQEYLSGLDSSPSTEQYIKIKKGDIKFENVKLKYGTDVILNNFNLHIKPGESISIVGKIGSGKSSLAKALLKLKSVDGGRILVDGVDIETIDPLSLRSQIMFVQQNPIPFNRTLYENIVYGNEHISRKQVEKLFEKYNLKSFFGKTGLDNVVGRKGEKISGGQRQTIFLLRILLGGDKKIVILDEPTSSLDEESSEKILALIDDVMKDRTVLIITHNKKLGEVSDRVVTLK